MRRQVEMALQGLAGFEDPDAALEQYETTASVASDLLQFAWGNGDLDGRVLDLGCGTGVLGIGAALYGARVTGFDIDAGALGVARRNVASAGVSDRVDWVRGDVSHLPFTRADTVIMNPPFGAQDEGADRAFLRAAGDIADVAYTVHNAGSLAFVESFVGESGEVTDAFRTELVLPRRFGFHEEAEREIEVEVYRIGFGSS
jgi:putative methylase